ncbi:ArsR family transcriptional regulator [Halorubrum sp. N11]|uniref:ArsR family transcriptional regulator n=1 Tax=Halorubrum sp. N11 TaxID=3402276 RepID=UPI003EBA9361
MDRLNQTDFKILEVLASGKRNVAANVALEIDADRAYINTRFGYLLSEDLVERVGPKEQSGLYVITTKGEIAVEHSEAYFADEINDFEVFVEQQL